MAQLKINSPYSRYGVGDLSLPGYSNTRGMGGLGASYGNRFFINTANPALLQRNNYMIYEVGLDYQLRDLSSSSASQSNADISLDYMALSLPITSKWNIGAGLKKYSQVNFEVNLLQDINDTDYTEIAYNGSGGLNQFNITNAYRILDDSSSNTTLSLGLAADLIFGQIETTSSSLLYIDNETTGQVYKFNNKNSYADFSFNPGVVFRKELMNCKTSKIVPGSDGLDSTVYTNTFACKKVAKKVLEEAKYGKYIIIYPNRRGVKLDKNIEDRVTRERLVKLYSTLAKKDYGIYVFKEAEMIKNDSLRKDFETLVVSITKGYKNKHIAGTENYIRKHSGMYWNVGFSYTFQTKLNGESQFSVDRDFSNGTSISKDTLVDGAANSIMLPSKFQVGISLEKPEANGKSNPSWWAIGIDLTYTNWEQFRGINVDIDYKNNYRLVLGGEITPDPLLLKRTSYFSRVTYRAGVHYGSTPYNIGGETFNDVGINFGMSMPIGIGTRLIPQRAFLWGVSLGQRGAITSGLVKEKYALLSLSFNINSRWFDRGRSKYGF